MTTIHRVYNFAAGPAVMPLPVLEEIQHDMLALPGTGMSILEISHRSKVFESILAEAEANIRALAGIPSNAIRRIVVYNATTNPTLQKIDEVRIPIEGSHKDATPRQIGDGGESRDHDRDRHARQHEPFQQPAHPLFSTGT